MPKLMIVDDHEALREGLEVMLSHSGHEVVGVAGNVAAALDLVAVSEPDIAIVDIRLPDGSGIALTRELLAQRPELGVILYTGDSDAELLYEGLDSGARGYALKAGSMEGLGGGIDRAAAGGSSVPPPPDSAPPPPRAPPPPPAWTGSCSPRGRPRACPSSRRASARSCT